MVYALRLWPLTRYEAVMLLLNIIIAANAVKMILGG